MKMTLLPLILVGLLGCSGTRDIAKASEKSRESATAIQTKSTEMLQTTQGLRDNVEGTVADLETAKDTGDVGPKAIPHVESAISRQGASLKYVVDLEHGLVFIHEQASSVTKEQASIAVALTSVQDNTPKWLEGLKTAAWIIVPLAFLALLWYTGIGTLIKKFFWSLGLLIPRSTDISAKFDAETLEDGAETPSPREAVAARRAADPAYDAAYLKHQKNIRANPLPPEPGEHTDGG